ncbi:putative Ion transport domain-containing protein [Helianthus annuus]|nr:putative Ion transport domain-containing protein [Helianthus annuus]
MSTKKVAIRYVTYDVPYGCGINTAISNDIPNFDWKAAPWGCFCFLNLLRLCRLRRVSELFSRLEKDTRFSYFMTRTIKLICVTLFAVHTAGCFYYWIATHHHISQDTWIGSIIENFEDRSIWPGYTYLMYWSIVTLTTVGYGDLHAVKLQ